MQREIKFNNLNIEFIIVSIIFLTSIMLPKSIKLTHVMPIHYCGAENSDNAIVRPKMILLNGNVMDPD